MFVGKPRINYTSLNRKKKKKKEKPSRHYAQQSLRKFFFSFTFMKPKCRLKILTRTSVFVVSDLQLQYLQMSGNFSSTLINSGNFINNNFILFFRSKASLGIQQRLKSRGFSTKFNTWGLRPEVQPLTLLYAISWQKRYPFFWQWYPFHIPSLELCTPLNCCKCTVFKIWINHKTSYSALFTAK